MSVVPLFSEARFYCSDCNELYYEHQQEKHAKCCRAFWCAGCGRAFSPGDEECQMCGGPPLVAA